MKKIWFALVVCLLSLGVYANVDGGQKLRGHNEFSALREEVKNLQRDIRRLESHILELSYSHNSSDDSWLEALNTTWGCYIERGQKSSYGVGRTKAEAIGKTLVACGEKDVGFCNARDVVCSTNSETSR